MIGKTCERCGKLFSIENRKKSQRFCSVKCSSGRTWAQRRPTFEPKKPVTYPYTCIACGKIFHRRKYPYVPKFCSSSCSAKHNWSAGALNTFGPRIPIPTFVCEFCGKTNERRPKIIRGVREGYDRRRFCDKHCANSAQFKGGHIHHSGYRIFTRKGKMIAEHREVMEKVLGRPLHEKEYVHHKNGIRNDNRPQNLELWSAKDPPGQRVADRIQWAIDFLTEYGYQVSGDPFFARL